MYNGPVLFVLHSLTSKKKREKINNARNSAKRTGLTTMLGTSTHIIYT